MNVPGMRALSGPEGADAFAAPEVEAWVRAALERGVRLCDAASREAERVLEGRGPVHVVATARGRWVVRRYRRGGLVAAPALGDRYLRVGAPRPLAEARASAEVRRRGIPTPRVVAGAVYARGPFYRADLVTEYVPDSADLARLLFEEAHPASAREGLLFRVGRLIGRAAAAGIEHPDLNAKNVLVEARPGGGEPMLLDLDRCRARPPGARTGPRAMLERLARSLRKHAARAGRGLSAAEWEALERGAAAGNPA